VEVSAFRTGRLGGEGLEGTLLTGFHDERDGLRSLVRRYPGSFRREERHRGRRVRAVGRAADRLVEDPLRIMRAVRFATELGFRIQPETEKTAQSMAGLLASVSAERVRDELVRILVSPQPSMGVLLMKRMGLLAIVVPELLESVGMRQDPRFHRFTVFRHTLETLDRVAPEPVLRLAALLHDVAKPRARERIAGRVHFYGHAKAGARLAGRSWRVSDSIATRSISSAT